MREEQTDSPPSDVPVTTDPPAPPAKNPAAVALGRLGGRKGGLARAKKLSPERRREIAREGGLARQKQSRKAE